MATKNDITKAEIKTPPASDLYRDNYDKIFKKKQHAKETGKMCDQGGQDRKE